MEQVLVISENHLGENLLLGVVSGRNCLNDFIDWWYKEYEVVKDWEEMGKEHSFLLKVISVNEYEDNLYIYAHPFEVNPYK